MPFRTQNYWPHWYFFYLPLKEKDHTGLKRHDFIPFKKYLCMFIILGHLTVENVTQASDLLLGFSPTFILMKGISVSQHLGTGAFIVTHIIWTTNLETLSKSWITNPSLHATYRLLHFHSFITSSIFLLWIFYYWRHIVNISIRVHTINNLLHFWVSVAIS